MRPRLAVLVGVVILITLIEIIFIQLDHFSPRDIGIIILTMALLFIPIMSSAINIYKFVTNE